MPRAIIFTTPTLIDIRSFTVMGLNAKPNSTSPIGYFGTGLKYSIAVLLRNKIQPILYIGRDKYTFYLQDTNFRGSEFQLVRMKREKWSLTRASHHDLPFTTELGKNWQLWQAYRELETNTLDENGTTLLIENDDIKQHAENYTSIVIPGEAFGQEHLNRDKTFLPNSKTKRETSLQIEILEGRSQHIYYRGMRVMDLDKPSLFTYNILSRIDLTEDRTVAYPYQIRSMLVQHITQSQDENLISTIISASDQFWEHALDFDYAYQSPSETFLQTIKKLKPQNASVMRYYSSYSSAEPESETIWDRFPLPFHCDADGSIRDDNDREILTLASYIQRDQEDKNQILEAITAAINRGAKTS